MQTGSSAVEYLFDPAGQRISTWTTGAGTAGFGIEGRIWMDGELLATRGGGNMTYFHHTNTLGTERMRTDASGNIATTSRSAAFGDGFSQTASAQSGVALDNQEFAGLDADSESGTHHANCRQYSSTQGSWMSPDPYDGSYDALSPQSFNRYVYALNNPVFYKDPSGQECFAPEDDDGDGGGGCNGIGDSGGGGGGDGGGSSGGGGGTYNPNDCSDPSVACVTTGEPGSPDPDPGVPVDPCSYAKSNLFGIRANCDPRAPGGGGTTGTTAPKNGTPTMPRTPAQCAGRAVKSNLLSFGADALGAIPGEGQVLAGAQLAAAGVGFVNGLVTKDAAGAAGSIVGGQFTLVSASAETLGVTGLKAVPVAGNLLSAFFAIRDVANGISDYQACLAGH